MFERQPILLNRENEQKLFKNGAPWLVQHRGDGGVRRNIEIHLII